MIIPDPCGRVHRTRRARANLRFAVLRCGEDTRTGGDMDLLFIILIIILVLALLGFFGRSYW
jgi:hypothetical protein